MIYFTAHTFKCVCHCRRAMFRVLGMYNFGTNANFSTKFYKLSNNMYVPNSKKCGCFTLFTYLRGWHIA